MKNILEVSDIQVVNGNNVFKPQNITSLYDEEILFLSGSINNHFKNKDSSFGDAKKQYYALNIYFKNIEDGLREMEASLIKYKDLEVLYILRIGSKNQDWNGKIFKYGNCIKIIFLKKD